MFNIHNIRTYTCACNSSTHYYTNNLFSESFFPGCIRSQLLNLKYLPPSSPQPAAATLCLFKSNQQKSQLCLPHSLFRHSGHMYIMFTELYTVYILWCTLYNLCATIKCHKKFNFMCSRNVDDPISPSILV